MWGKTKNLAQIDKGNFRSIAGYAGESLAIGRALLCGYNLFFKAWRDAKYDAVLDYNGVLFRIEIKQTQTDKQLSVTAGGRSGQQIDKSVKSREEVLSTQDCDFLIGVQSLSGACWIVPIEFVEILGKKTLRFDFLEQFKECWGLFRLEEPSLTVSSHQIHKGFRRQSLADLNLLCSQLNILITDNTEVQLGPRTFIPLSATDYRVVRIWQELARRCQMKNDSFSGK
jgi:hypothetical protein